MLKFNGNQINDLFAAIAAAKKLYLPVEKGGEVVFGEWSEDAAVRLDALKTVKSAKDMFFPQTEDLMHFQMKGKEISIEPAANEMDEFVVFGVRACDCKSFRILDRVFLSDPVDSYYELRRKSGTIVGFACAEPEESCFCSLFKIDATEPDADVVTWMVDGTLYWEAKTEKGAALTETVQALLTESDDKAVEEQKAFVKDVMTKLPLASLSLERFEKDSMMDFFNRPEWPELSKACLGCGTCTFVCPTCQCYDIRDYDTGHGVQRYRCWDSCMYSDFTLMAGGQPRMTQVERFRQRFMHKLVYFPMNNDGEYSCVGCGRCVTKCPISMNIAKVIKALGEE